MQTLQLFRSLRNPVFARLYTAQTMNLLGDALTWVGLALLAFELAGKNSAVVLSVFQGRVYSAQFAWSHLWWVFSYPLAGWLGSHQKDLPFLYGGLIGLVLLVIVQTTLSPKGQEHGHESHWHEHEHEHDEYHRHKHHPGIPESELHLHPHQHPAIRHVHPYSDSHHFHGHG